MKTNTMIFSVIMITFCVLNSCTNPSIPEQPTQLISTDFAKQLHTNFNTPRQVPNDIIKDANAIWYSIEELEKYINYIKTEGKSKGYAVDGIRLYFGRYPNETEYKEKAGMATIFLSPTGDKNAQKASMLNVTTTQEARHPDITELSPLNYGSMGNPPKVSYPSN